MFTIKHVHTFSDKSLLEVLRLTVKVNEIMATQQEVIQILVEAAAQAQKSRDELKGAIDALNARVYELSAQLVAAQVASTNVSDDLLATAQSVKAMTQQLDDIIPDAPVQQ